MFALSGYWHGWGCAVRKFGLWLLPLGLRKVCFPFKRNQHFSVMCRGALPADSIQQSGEEVRAMYTANKFIVWMVLWTSVCKIYMLGCIAHSTLLKLICIECRVSIQLLERDWIHYDLLNPIKSFSLHYNKDFWPATFMSTVVVSRPELLSHSFYKHQALHFRNFSLSPCSLIAIKNYISFNMVFSNLQGRWLCWSCFNYPKQHNPMGSQCCRPLWRLCNVYCWPTGNHSSFRPIHSTPHALFSGPYGTGGNSSHHLQLCI